MAGILAADPVPGDLDRAHMRAIHRRLFSDVYEWAGQERVGPVFPERMTKGGPSPDSIAAGRYDADDGHPYSYFPAGQEMAAHFDRWVGTLHVRGDYRSMSGREFAEAIAEPWGEINVAHLFREGNTRTQVAFFTYFARHHGQVLDYGRFLDASFRHRFNAGRFLVQAGKSPALLVDTLAEATGDPAPAVPGPTGGRPRSVGDDYQPHYASRAYMCGAPTTKGSGCRRQGRCPYHGGDR